MDETQRLKECLVNAHKLIDQLREEKRGLMTACRSALNGAEDSHEKCLNALNNCSRFKSGRPDVAVNALQDVLACSNVDTNAYRVSQDALLKLGLL